MFEYTWRSQNARRFKTLINKFNSRTLDGQTEETFLLQ